MVKVLGRCKTFDESRSIRYGGGEEVEDPTRRLNQIIDFFQQYVFNASRLCYLLSGAGFRKSSNGCNLTYLGPLGFKISRGQ
jgi:hypothetical protein